VRSHSPAARSRKRALAAVAPIAAIVIVSVAPLSEAAVSRDLDRDGLSNRYELKRSHTQPRRSDTDADHLLDGFEERRSHTNPRLKDTDADGLWDGYEVRRSKTSPLRKNTDRDGTSDAIELLSGTDPLTRGKKKGHGLPPPDTTPPDTTITYGPSGTVATSDASFEFSSSEAGSSFECRLDGAAWGKCGSPSTESRLVNGSHTFDVRAIDAAANTDLSPATRTWTVAAASPEPPTASFTWSPQNPQNPPVTVGFTSNGACAATPCTYEWRQGPPGSELIGTGPTASWTYQSTGTKTVALRVTDALGRYADATNSFTVSSSATPPPACSNGQDDDADGTTDFPADPGCTDAKDTTESPDPLPAPQGVLVKQRVCFNIHANYGGIYGNVSQMKTDLDYLGTDCVRDQLPPNDVDRNAATWNTLGKQVIAYCGGYFSTWQWEGSEASCVQQFKQKVNRPVAVEGMNEPYCGDGTGLANNTERLRQHMIRLRDAATPLGLDTLSVALCNPDWWRGAPISGIVSNYHTYTPCWPAWEPSFWPNDSQNTFQIGWYKQFPFSDTGRLASTEAGRNLGCVNGDESLHAQIELVAVLLHLKNGWDRMALYQLYDEGTQEPCSRDACWGFWSNSHVKHKVADATHNFMGQLGDTVAAPLAGVTYTASGANLDSMSFRAATNQYVALWNSAYVSSPRNATLGLSTALPVSIYDPVTGQTDGRAASASHTITLGNDPVIVRVG
jgi:hypothetical protein